MKTRRINLEGLSVSDLEGKALYCVTPGDPDATERLEPTHMHIFGNGNLLICLEETNQASMTFDSSGVSIFSSLELHEEVQEGWILIQFSTDPTKATVGDTLKTSGVLGCVHVFSEEEAKRIQESTPYTIIINLAEAGRKE